MSKGLHPIPRSLAEIAKRVARGSENSPFARNLQAEVNRMVVSAEALDNVRANRNPSDTPEAHAIKVGKLAKKFDREVTATINRASDHYRAGLKDIQRRMDEKVKLVPNEFAAEVRSRFFGMNAEERSNFIHGLVENNSGPILAAIVKAPPELTGITEDRRSQYEKMIVTKHASEEYDERERLEESMSAVQAASRASSNLVRDFTDPIQLAAIEKREAEANNATAGFEQSLK